MAWTLPNSLTSELDAVNTVLRAKGLESATTVNLDDGEVADAVFHLDTADREFQSKGWWFNTDYGLKLSPNMGGDIELPEGCLSVAGAYWAATPGPLKNVVERAGKLYNQSDQTFTWTTPYVVDITVRLDYTDMPEVARRYVATLAAHRAQALDQGNTTVIQVTSQDVYRALALVEQQQDKANPQNQVHDNVSVVGAVGGFGGLRRSRIT